MQLADRLTAAQTATLIHSKMIPPVSPAHVISRPRLLEAMDTGARRRVTVVVGPAGFGKTVLVTDWLRSEPRRSVAWVSLDSSDNSPSRFWTYVLAALAGAGVDVPGAQTTIATVGAAPAEHTLAHLANALSELDRDLFLVLDDYHLINDATIHRDLAFLIDRQLEHLRLVVLSRTEPPLQLSRWRTYGHVMEVRASSLAFTDQEATAYLIEQGVSLTQALWESLYSRVGGWAAAMHLVALWAADHADEAAAIAGFHAADRAIEDYLLSEVLAGLPDDLREFVLRTSVLPRLNGSLCDALTGGDQGAATLRELFRRGLFLESLDADGTWFRYHQLFADLLRTQLQRNQPELVPTLHKRASAWCEANGQAADAIDHSIKSEDWANVQRLMLGEVLAIGARYQPAVIGSWLELVPAPVMRAGPFFQLMLAFTLGHIGHLDAAQRAIDRARTLLSTAEPGAVPGHVEILVNVVAGGIARVNCDLDAMQANWREVIALVERADDKAADINEMAQAAAGNSLSTTLFFHGDITGAEAHAVAVEQRTDDQHLVRMHASALGTKALVLASTGRLRQAETVADKALKTAGTVGILELFQVSGALLARAVVATERGHDDEAGERLAEVSRRAERHADRGFEFLTAVLLAQHEARVGQVERGLAIIHGLRSRWSAWSPPTSLLAQADAAEIRLCLQLGDFPAAAAVETRMSRLPDSHAPVTVIRQLATALTMRAERRFREALTLFRNTEDLAGSTGQITAVVEAQVQSAMLHQLLGEDARTSLRDALVTALDDRIVAPFLEDPQSARRLLLTADTDGEDVSTRTFRQELLQLLGIPSSQPAVPRSTGTVRPSDLTDRERTVLRLLGAGLTRTDMASALGISQNTLKTHLRQIYAKLGVNSRRQAVLLASNGIDS